MRRNLLTLLLGVMAEIRPAQISDLDVVVSWLRNDSDCAFWAGPRLSFPVNLAVLPESIDWEQSESWSVTSGENVIGFGQLVAKPRRRFHLARLIASPQYRRKGIGRLLAEHLVKMALSKAPSALSLYVSPDNRPALNLYLALGFSVSTQPLENQASELLYMEHDTSLHI